MIPLEEHGEILHVHDAAVESHGLDLDVGGGEEVGCVLHASRADEIRQGLALFSVKDGGEVARGQILGLGQGAEGEISAKRSVKSCFQRGWTRLMGKSPSVRAQTCSNRSGQISLVIAATSSHLAVKASILFYVAICFKEWFA